MDEKITNLITELAAECAKEKVILSLCAFDKSGIAIGTQVGNNAMKKIAIDQQVEAWFESLEKCGCAGCKAMMAEYDSDEDDETEEQPNPTVDPVEFSQKLEKFLQENSLRGDL